MKSTITVRFIYLLLALLLLGQPIVFGHQTLQADSWVFQDDFSGSLLWSKVISGYGPGSPAPPATTGTIAIDSGELHIKADYWWYQVHAVRTFSGVAGDFQASARFRIMPDSGDASSADIAVSAGPFSATENPNVLAALGTDAYYHDWVIFVQGVEVERIAATVPKDTWTQVGISRTAGVLKFIVNGLEIFQCPAPSSPAIDRMALGTSIGIHWEGGPHAHFDDASLFAGSVPEGTFFFDDFETYAVGSFPSAGGWQLTFDGKGAAYQVIVDTCSVSGTRSFQLWGVPGWSATAERHFSTGADLIGFEAYLRAEDYFSGEYSATVGFWNRDNGPWGTKYAVVQFTEDGFIQGASQVEARNLQSYAPDTWYKIRLLLDRTMDTFSVWVDGVLRASSIATASSYDIDAIEVDSRWGGVQCYYDDVKVFAGSNGVNSPPNTPSNPSPANRATGVSINANLSWTGGDPDGDSVTYDVYFEKDDSTPDQLVSNDQSGTSYDPGTLDYSSHYYWKIEAKDEHGATNPGPVWDFTTRSGSSGDTTAPTAVVNLAVSQVTTDSVSLTWKAPGDDGNIGTATLYDIRYSASQITQANWASATQVSGETSPKPAGSSETFTVTGLQAGKTYYFAIKTADEIPNWSALSNIVTTVTPTAYVEVTPPSWDFNVLVVGGTAEKQLIITNMQEKDITITDIITPDYIELDHGCWFDWWIIHLRCSAMPPIDLSPGESKTFTFTLDSDSLAGIVDDTIAIKVKPKEGGEVQTVAIPVRGTVVSDPEVLRYYAEVASSLAEVFRPEAAIASAIGYAIQAVDNAISAMRAQATDDYVGTLENLNKYLENMRGALKAQKWAATLDYASDYCPVCPTTSPGTFDYTIYIDGFNAIESKLKDTADDLGDGLLDQAGDAYQEVLNEITDIDSLFNDKNKNNPLERSDSEYLKRNQYPYLPGDDLTPFISETGNATRTFRQVLESHESLVIIADSPVDLIVESPLGEVLSKTINEILDSKYLETDLDGDGEKEDVVVIYSRQPGVYLVTPIPQEGATPEETYSLGWISGDEKGVLAEDHPVADIPAEGYLVTCGLPQDDPIPEVGFASLIAEGKLVIAYNFDPFTTVPTAVNGWTWFDPTLLPAQNNLAKLSKNTAYWVKVTEECRLTYGKWNQPHLAAGWNNPVWLGC
jgi:hypothetical protein